MKSHPSDDPRKKRLMTLFRRYLASRHANNWSLVSYSLPETLESIKLVIGMVFGILGVIIAFKIFANTNGATFRSILALGLGAYVGLAVGEIVVFGQIIRLFRRYHLRRLDRTIDEIRTVVLPEENPVQGYRLSPQPEPIRLSTNEADLAEQALNLPRGTLRA